MSISHIYPYLSVFVIICQFNGPLVLLPTGHPYRYEAPDSVVKSDTPPSSEPQRACACAEQPGY